MKTGNGRSREAGRAGGLGSNTIDGGNGKNTVSYADLTDAQNRGVFLDLGDGVAYSKRAGLNDKITKI